PNLLALCATYVLLGAIGADIMLSASMLTAAAYQVGTERWDQLPAELTEAPMSTPTVIKDQGGEEIATFYAEDRSPVERDEISDHRVDAIIAIEDERFYEQGGVDGQGVARAAVRNIVSDTQQGPHTWTQQ